MIEGKAKGNEAVTAQHHDEVETLTLLRGVPVPAHDHVHTTSPSDTHEHERHHPHTQGPPEKLKTTHPPSPLDEPTLTAALSQLPKESVYRVKGFIRFTSSSSTPAANDESRPWWILNWAFGRWELVPAPAFATSSLAASEEVNDDKCGVVRLTVMGERGEVRRYAERLASALGAVV